MYFIEWLAGVENAHLLLADHQPEVETLFEALHRVLVQKAGLLCEHSPADVLYMTENTSTTLISPAQYRRYCARHVGEYARLAHEADRNLILHMCGHLKAILPDLAAIPARAFEAFTSPTLGNTTLRDGRQACPDKCLIGGTNAILWTRTADEIIAKIEADLSDLPHHRGIVVTSAGVMPPMCKPETIKRVCEWVKRYPARMDEPR
jgi:uroporphyrinogen-III decarboxylase